MGELVKVRRDKLVACITCPLCNKLLKEATTISPCLHTFCRTCIQEKLSIEVDCCPVCNINLGRIPMQKLRPDHSIQDIRDNIFPSKRRKIIAPKIMPTISPPPKRKERSLSSLVVSTPRVLIQSGVTGRRTKPGGRRAMGPREPNFTIEKPVKNEQDSKPVQLHSSSASQTLNKHGQNKKQRCIVQWDGCSPSDASTSEFSTSRPERADGDSGACQEVTHVYLRRRMRKTSPQTEHLNHEMPEKDSENGIEPLEKIDDFWIGVNSHLETASKTKSPNERETEACMDRAKVEERMHKRKFREEKKQKKLLNEPVIRKRRKKVASKGSYVLSQAATVNFCANSPIWLSLVASEDGEGVIRLPQIPARYLRIKDGNMKVSSIQKYLIEKLDLRSDAEVEIKCEGHLVLPTLQLSNLLELWLRITSSSNKRVWASVGGSAKEFVMVLSYSQRVQAS